VPQGQGNMKRPTKIKFGYTDAGAGGLRGGRGFP